MRLSVGKKNKIKLKCDFCNFVFMRPPSGVNKTNFCSRKCHTDSTTRDRRSVICKFCGAKVRHKTRTFCDIKCYSSHIQAKRGKITCRVCSKTVNRTPKDIDKNGTGNLFCSQRCFGVWYTDNKTQSDDEKFKMKCVICGNITMLSKHKKSNLKRKTCSTKCTGLLRTKLHTFNTKCNYCKRHLTLNLNRKNRKNNYCGVTCADSGHSILMSGEGNSRYVDGRGASGYHSGWNVGFKDKIRKRFFNECCICGVHERTQKTKLDIHHIDSNTQNPDKNNLVPLCRWCHLSTVHGGSKKCKEKWLRELSALAVMVNEYIT